MFFKDCMIKPETLRGVFRGGYGAKPPPGPVKSMDFRGFQAPTGAEPPWKEKKFKPGGA